MNSTKLFASVLKTLPRKFSTQKKCGCNDICQYSTKRIEQEEFQKNGCTIQKVIGAIPVLGGTIIYGLGGTIVGGVVGMGLIMASSFYFGPVNIMKHNHAEKLLKRCRKY